MSAFRVNLSCIPAEAVILARDYCEGQLGINASVSYCGDEAEIVLPDEECRKRFTEELNDYIRRITAAVRTRAVKEMIIGRALYGIAGDCK